MFQFKQFSVDQSGCAMKINTDGVLLGALAGAGNPQNILDIGTGTGVIALMLAQRFDTSQVDAVEIDGPAAETAERNLSSSPFSNRLKLYPVSFESFFNTYPAKKYDLIVSNPPFHINSLNSPKATKSLAKHVGEDFFSGLISDIALHLTESGLCWLILPLQAAAMVKALAIQNKLYLQKIIAIRSFRDDNAHREVVVFGYRELSAEISNLTIYKAENSYTEDYLKLLKPYFIAF